MTNDNSLAGARILVVEDEYYIADDVRSMLAGLGAEVLGPIPSVSQARAFIGANPAIDCVLLDINLRGELAFDIADLLRERGIHFAFVTGYDHQALPGRFLTVARMEKPVRVQHLAQLLQTIATAGKSAGSI